MFKNPLRDFPGGSVAGCLAAGAADVGLIPGPGRSNVPIAAEPVSHNY